MKKVYVFLVVFFLVGSSIVLAQENVGIGTTSPNSNALLELAVPDPAANPMGLLLPRLNSSQRSTLGSGLVPADQGLVVYDIDLDSTYLWTGSTWTALGAGSADNLGNGIATSDISLDGFGIRNSTSGTVGFTMEDNGNVKIGGVPGAPSQPLVVQKNQNSGSYIVSSNQDATDGAYAGIAALSSTHQTFLRNYNAAASGTLGSIPLTNKTVLFNNTDASGFIFANEGNDPFIWSVNGAERMSLDAGAFRLGIPASGYRFPLSRGVAGQVLITDGSGSLSWQNVPGDNLGSHTASTNLDMAGNAIQDASGFQLTSGAMNNYILSSDASGNASWVDPSTLPGDNLGSGSAASNISLNTFWISNDGDAEGLKIDDDGNVAVNSTAVTDAKLFITSNNNPSALEAERTGNNNVVNYAVRGENRNTGNLENFGTYGEAIGSSTGINIGASGLASNANTNIGLSSNVFGTATDNIGLELMSTGTVSGQKIGTRINLQGSGTGDVFGVNIFTPGLLNSGTFTAYNFDITSTTPSEITGYNGSINSDAAISQKGLELSLVGNAGFSNNKYGALLTLDGTADTNTAAFLSATGGSDNLALHTKRGNVLIENDDLLVSSGRVLIGDNSAPNNALQIDGSSTTGILLTNPALSTGFNISVVGTGFAQLAVRDNERMEFWTNNTQRMTLEANGRLQVGNVNGTGLFSVAESQNAPLISHIENPNGGASASALLSIQTDAGFFEMQHHSTGNSGTFGGLSQASAAILRTYSGASRMIIGNQDNVPIDFVVNNTDLFQISSSGIRYGDPTLSNDYTLPLTRGTAGQTLVTDAAGNATWQTISGGGDDLGSHLATQNVELDGFYLSNDGDNEGIRISDDGQVGINNTPTSFYGLEILGSDGFASSGAARVTYQNLTETNTNALQVQNQTALNASTAVGVYSRSISGLNNSFNIGMVSEAASANNNRGVDAIVSGGSGTKIGFRADINGATTPFAKGFEATINTSGASNMIGAETNIPLSATATAAAWGYNTQISTNSAGSGIVGYRAEITSDGGGGQHGAFLRLTGDDGGNDKYGVEVDLSGDALVNTGVQSRVEGGLQNIGGSFSATGTIGSLTGVQGTISGANSNNSQAGQFSNATTTAPITYGINVDNRGTATTNQYGVFSSVQPTAASTATKYAFFGSAASNDATAKYGVYGEAGGNGGRKFGVFGISSGTGLNWAGYFEGTAAVRDSLVIGGVAIDQPEEPLHIIENTADATGSNGAYLLLNNKSNNNGTTSGILFRNDGLGNGFYKKGAIYYERQASDGRGRIVLAVNGANSSANVNLGNDLFSVDYRGLVTTHGVPVMEANSIPLASNFTLLPQKGLYFIEPINSGFTIRLSSGIQDGQMLTLANISSVRDFFIDQINLLDGDNQYIEAEQSITLVWSAAASRWVILSDSGMRD